MVCKICNGKKYIGFQPDPKDDSVVESMACPCSVAMPRWWEVWKKAPKLERKEVVGSEERKPVNPGVIVPAELPPLKTKQTKDEKTGLVTDECGCFYNSEKWLGVCDPHLKDRRPGDKKNA